MNATTRTGSPAGSMDTHAQKGLTLQQVLESRERYGPNTFTREKPAPLWRRLWEAASEPMLLMLILAGLITLGVNIVQAVTEGHADFLECVGIFAAISLSVVITVVMEGRSAKAFDTLNKMGDGTLVRVLREGEIQLVPQKDIVVGDILCVETGDKLPADGRLLESTALTADESALTGESMPVKKDANAVCGTSVTPLAEQKNRLFSGCFITGGYGRLVVTGVGDHTEFGKIARELTSTQKSSTPLQEKMAKLGKRITLLGSIAAAAVFLLQLALFLMNGTADLGTISNAFVTSIVLIVAAVPEGLPTIVAVSLAVNIIKMSRQNALVKKMIACETVGCINVICSDKTGTLTENRMAVTAVYGSGGVCSPEKLRDQALLRNFCLNSTADVHFDGEMPRFIGSPTECALLAAARQAGTDYLSLRREVEIAHVFPFSSETKNMTTLVKEPGGVTAYTKGSPEKIIAMCEMGDADRRACQGQILKYQEKACRVLGFAHKAVGTAGYYGDKRALMESGMQFDGFAAISDPLREDVYDSVNCCRRAGIELKMLTGDNIATATAIANELHLLDENHSSVEAAALERMTDEELSESLPGIRVIARSTPLVKMRVVNALKEAGNVVAVTGDGINDAPAIKNADVGVAMGISGTEVSKEASDIVLLDDSFSTIVKAVQWGRGIYENFQRFIQFQLTVNLSSVIVVLASILLGRAAPFTALQLLWINIIMDGPPALTLGLEPIRGDLMNRRPTSRGASIITCGMFTRIAVNGVYISLVLMAQSQFNFLGGTAGQRPTILFTLFVVFQLFNAFNSRELTHTSIFRNLSSNKLMLGVFGLTFALQILITQFCGAFFGTAPLDFLLWVKIVAVAVTVILLSELAKGVLRVGRRLFHNMA